MAQVKDRGKDAKAEKVESAKTDDSERFLNLGSKITLKSGRTTTVRDVPFSAWLSGFSEVIPILVTFSDKNLSETQMLTRLAMDKTCQQALYNLMSSATELSPEEISQLGAEDSLRVIASLKKVIDFAEVKKLFSEVGLQMTTPSTAKRKA